MKKYDRSLVRQIDQSDCGVACLLTLINYYKGHGTLENLRRLSGTTKTGTTLLGLYQAANKSGFLANGCNADIKALREHGAPVILHVLRDNMQHYLVCFESTQNGFVIGDPERGVLLLSEEELGSIWKSGMCLTLQPTEDFTTYREAKSFRIRWITQFLKDDAAFLSTSVIIGVGIAALGLTMAIFSQKLIDTILPGKDFSKLYFGLTFVFLLLLLREILSALRQYFLLRQSRDFGARIIDYFYSHLLKLPKIFYDTRKIGELTARLSDTSRIQRVVSQVVGNAVADILIILVSLVILFKYSWHVGIGCITALPLYGLLIFKNRKKIITGQRQVMINYAITESNYVSTLQGIETIKNFNTESRFQNINKLVFQKYQGAVFLFGKIQIRLSFVANVFAISFLISVLCYGSHMVMHGMLKIGELMAILGITTSLFPSITNVALLSIPINEVSVALERMLEFSETPPEDRSRTALIHELNKISVCNVSFRFAGRGQLLKNVSLEIVKGEIAALVGESGSGKSTLVQILQRFYTPENGAIVINEHQNIYEISLEDWRRKVVVVSQNVHIFNGTVIENILFDDMENLEDVLSFLNESGFATYIDKLPQSLMTIVGEEGINLSGGQKQLIAIARALYRKPEILILDEATSAMDRSTERFILHLLSNRKKEMGILFITHKLHLLKRLSDCIYLLNGGTITNSGTHDYLLNNEIDYRDYWKDFSGA